MVGELISAENSATGFHSQNSEETPAAELLILYDAP